MTDRQVTFEPQLRVGGPDGNGRLRFDAAWRDDYGDLQVANRVFTPKVNAPRWWIRFRCWSLMNFARDAARLDAAAYDTPDDVQRIVEEINRG